ncbi:hypothetical protein PVAND_011364 [Polypedilum vanderplanki]|uniref:phospholipase A2 n=1 Tax=Polypedilum vanderplanki TaxID=319348 RepID=A0A9J6CIX9_POLVA|nr:hypothetical protein PVAND_011364 [Polypedilum vanderplanki]
MFSAIKNLLTGEIPPSKVIEKSLDSIASYNVLQRDDCMLLFAPQITDNSTSNTSSKSKKFYEIILYRPASESINSSYSLFRAETQEEALARFEAYTHRVPNFVTMVNQYYNIPGLQKVCDLLTENPSWSIAHLVAYFNLTEYLSNPAVAELIDYPDHVKYMTPLQVAIKAKNIEVVKGLLNVTKLDHLDYNSNGIFHYAANTSKEMINILTSKSLVNLNHINLDGITPLHHACLSNNPDCVNALVCAGADVNISAKHVNGSGKGGNKLQNRNAPSTTTSPSGTVAEFFQTNANKVCREEMKNGGTPLHWASSREVLEVLIERGCHIDSLDFNGRSALHVMVLKNQLDCVVSLLAHEAEIDLKDKDGNTPLHIAVEKKFIPIVQCLVVFGCDINMKNKNDQTARHMVGKEASGSNDDMILYILHSVGAKRCPDTSTRCPVGCNAKGTYNGIPPAQPETTEQREAIQQMLATTTSQLMRGRNSVPTIANQQLFRLPKEQPVLIDTTAEQKGQSVMDALLGMFTSKIQAAAKKEVPVCDKGTSTAEDENVEVMEEDHECSASEEDSVNSGSRGRLLCLDGGGIRGLVLVQMLLEIEQLSQTPIHFLFDWIAGTSTGGILALGIGSGKTMKQCMCLYLKMKNVAFNGSRPYSSDPLENVLKENLGEHTVMAEIQHPKIMVSAVMADRKPVDLHFFRNYKTASDILNIATPTSNRRIPPPSPENQLIWRAARATGAAPSYFRAFGRFLDGGLIANNPTLDAMTEIHEYNMALYSVNRKNEAVPLSIVVSLGTGLPPTTELKDIDVFRPDSIWDTAKLAYGISAIGNLLVDQATLADGRVVDRARAWCSMIGVPYFRFNPQMSVDLAMDEKMDAPLINMMWETKAYMYQNRNKVIEMVNLLK